MADENTPPGGAPPPPDFGDADKFPVTPQSASDEAELRRAVAKGRVLLKDYGLDENSAFVMSAILNGYDMTSACHLAGLTIIEFQVGILMNAKSKMAFEGLIQHSGIQAFFAVRHEMANLRDSTVVSAGKREFLRLAKWMAETSLPHLFAQKARRDVMREAVNNIEDQRRATLTESEDVADTPVIMDAPTLHENQQILESMPGVEFSTRSMRQDVVSSMRGGGEAPAPKPAPPAPDDEVKGL